MIIVNGVIVFIVLMWCVLIKIWNSKKEPIYQEESDILFQKPEDKLIMTKSNKKYLLKINQNRKATRPSTIFTVHQNKYNALELNASQFNSRASIPADQNTLTNLATNPEFEND